MTKFQGFIISQSPDRLSSYLTKYVLVGNSGLEGLNMGKDPIHNIV